MSYTGLLKNALELRFVELHMLLKVRVQELKEIDITKPLTAENFETITKAAAAEARHDEVERLLAALPSFEIEDK